MRIEFLSVCGGLFISQQMLAQTDSIANTQELSDVVVTATNGIKSKFRADNTEIIGKGQLIRAACCNLGESFTTNPSVDVSYSDAATGARQIKLLGLSGTYVQMLTENIPNLRGAALPYSLGYVPGPWTGTEHLPQRSLRRADRRILYSRSRRTYRRRGVR